MSNKIVCCYELFSRWKCCPVKAPFCYLFFCKSDFLPTLFMVYNTQEEKLDELKVLLRFKIFASFNLFPALQFLIWGKSVS